MNRAILLLLPAALLAGCDQATAPDFRADVTRLNGELDATRGKLTAVEKELAAKKDELAKAAANAFMAEAAKKEAEETDQAIAQKDQQIQKLQAEVDALKKSEASAFVEASGYQQKGLTTIALDRYQQFVKNNPNSPLVTDANRAIAELTITAEKEAKWRAGIIDPKRGERELMQRIADNTASAEELAPLLKRKTAPEVVKLLGQPNKSFRNNTELGYVDKIIDTATGNKATLVVIFEEGRVVSLRVGYTGRSIKP